MTFTLKDQWRGLLTARAAGGVSQRIISPNLDDTQTGESADLCEATASVLVYISEVQLEVLLLLL